MHAASSSSLSLSQKTKKPHRPPIPTPSSPPSCSSAKKRQTRRKGNGFIEKEQDRKKTRSKRSKGLVKRAQDNHSLTGAPIAVITFNDKDELCSFGSPSVEEVFLMYLRKKYDPKLFVSLKEWLDGAEKKRDSCKTKDLENDLSVNAGAGQGYGVGAGRDLSTLASTEDSNDHDNPLTSPDLAITSGESSAGNSNPMWSDLNMANVEYTLDISDELMNDPVYGSALWQLLSHPNPKGHENNADHNGLDGFGLFAI